MSPESTSIECVVEVAADPARDSPTKLARGRPLTGALAQHGLHGLTNARCHRLADIRVTLKRSAAANRPALGGRAPPCPARHHRDTSCPWHSAGCGVCQ